MRISDWSSDVCSSDLLTTEGGLDVAAQLDSVRAGCQRLAKAGIAVSLFIDADAKQLKAAIATGAPHLEIHTGHYADTRGTAQAVELRRISAFAKAAHRAGFKVHAGHGLTTANVAAIADRKSTRLNSSH